jgi:hypothetical protein
MPRDPNDIPCGGLINIWLINYIPSQYELEIKNIHTFTAELIDYLRTAAVRPDTSGAAFNDLRMDFVLGKKTEKQWQHSIYLQERHNDRILANFNIKTTFTTLAIERFRQLSEDLSQDSVKPTSLRRHETNEKYFREENKKTDKRSSIYAEFVVEMGEIRKFINHTIIEEMIPLGTKNPRIISSGWKWEFSSKTISRSKKIKAACAVIELSSDESSEG